MYMYVREYRRTNTNDQFRETGNIDEEKNPGKNTTLYVLATTMYKQTQIT